MANIGGASREEFIGIMQMIIPGSILYVTSLWSIKIALAADINYWITILTNIFSDVIIISLPISMVLNLQMPLKQRLGVAAMFALGFSVVIASCIRAYFSKLNETMLTCTVSMIETAVAIIATCLPVLRTLILGQISRVGTSSAGRHYELSSSHHARVIAQSRAKNTTYSVGATTKANESEDELVKEEASRSSEFSSIAQDPKGIEVTTEYRVFEEHRPTGQLKLDV
ncbi:hypothetical protein M7I_1973 [Glarea lozoyensis 74030]|uniref:Rhodopsin domain-containing protein n=1 Tax=Glarea lozoyensis (strain ATCC 74030 / MF5533) TaxID=1104152 RepID=H0EHJ3_GLAL7|nr:hypothetical protein M7I_1973 [Glarea lozoyensis 74030]